MIAVGEADQQQQLLHLLPTPRSEAECLPPAATAQVETLEKACLLSKVAVLRDCVP